MRHILNDICYAVITVCMAVSIVSAACLPFFGLLALIKYLGG